MLPIHCYFGLMDEFDKFYSVKKIDCTMDRTCIKLSNYDIDMLCQVMTFQ